MVKKIISGREKKPAKVISVHPKYFTVHFFSAVTLYPESLATIDATEMQKNMTLSIVV